MLDPRGMCNSSKWKEYNEFYSWRHPSAGGKRAERSVILKNKRDIWRFIFANCQYPVHVLFLQNIWEWRRWQKMVLCRVVGLAVLLASRLPAKGLEASAAAGACAWPLLPTKETKKELPALNCHLAYLGLISPHLSFCNSMI